MADKISKQIILHQGDLPAEVSFSGSVAIDTETLGLNPLRDKLCLVQLSAGDGMCHLVKFDVTKPYDAPNLAALLEDASITKIFHFARFDVAVLKHYLGVVTAPVYCTKIASKLVRTYTNRHGLKDLCSEMLGVSLSKEQQSSNWASPMLTKEQCTYAASDVLYLHGLKEKLDHMLAQTNRMDLAMRCFEFLSTCVELDLSGWEAGNLFSHS